MARARTGAWAAASRYQHWQTSSTSSPTAARNVNSSAVPSRAASASTRVMATAARFSVVAGSLAGSRFEEKEVLSRLPAAVSEAFQVASVYDFGVASESLRFFDRQSEKRTQPKAIAWQ